MVLSEEKKLKELFLLQLIKYYYDANTHNNEIELIKISKGVYDFFIPV